MLNHRSIVEGVRMSGVKVKAFRHNNMVDLEQKLKRACDYGQTDVHKVNTPGFRPWRKILIIVEGIYSMEGDLARLREIVALKQRYGAQLYLDEAHSIGAVGKSGRGVCEVMNVPFEYVDLMMGTFTKSFGSAGGYLAGDKEVIENLRRNSAGSLFGCAMSPAMSAQALSALEVIDRDPKKGKEKLASIRENSNYFRRRLIDLGFKVIGDLDSPVIPTLILDVYGMQQFSLATLDEGIAAVVVCYPAAPAFLSRARFCISAAHTKPQLEATAQKLARIADRFGLLFGKKNPRYIDEKYQEHIRSWPSDLDSFGIYEHALGNREGGNRRAEGLCRAVADGVVNSSKGEWGDEVDVNNHHDENGNKQNYYDNENANNQNNSGTPKKFTTSSNVNDKSPKKVPRSPCSTLVESTTADYCAQLLGVECPVIDPKIQDVPSVLAKPMIGTGGDVLAKVYQKGGTFQEQVALQKEGRKNNPNFAVMDFLGLIRDPPAKLHGSYLTTNGFGTCGPRGFYGTTLEHLALENALATLYQKESACFYSHGVSTASSVLAAIMIQGDIVFADSRCHYGIKAGLRLNRNATVVFYDTLEQLSDMLNEMSEGDFGKREDSEEEDADFKRLSTGSGSGDNRLGNGNANKDGRDESGSGTDSNTSASSRESSKDSTYGGGYSGGYGNVGAVGGQFKNCQFRDCMPSMSAAQGGLKGLGEYQRRYLVTEGLFACDGTIADLPQIIDLKLQHDLTLVVDEQLGLGTVGRRGVIDYWLQRKEHQKDSGNQKNSRNQKNNDKNQPRDRLLQQISLDKIDMYMGSLELSVASVGGFVVFTGAILNKTLRLTSSGYCFSASSPAISCIWSLHAIKNYVCTEEERAGMGDLLSERGGGKFKKKMLENGGGAPKAAALTSPNTPAQSTLGDNTAKHTIPRFTTLQTNVALFHQLLKSNEFADLRDKYLISGDHCIVHFRPLFQLASENPTKSMEISISTLPQTPSIPQTGMSYGLAGLGGYRTPPLWTGTPSSSASPSPSESDSGAELNLSGLRERRNLNKSSGGFGNSSDIFDVGSPGGDSDTTASSSPMRDAVGNVAIVPAGNGNSTNNTTNRSLFSTTASTAFSGKTIATSEVELTLLTKNATLPPSAFYEQEYSSRLRTTHVKELQKMQWKIRTKFGVDVELWQCPGVEVTLSRRLKISTQATPSLKVSISSLHKKEQMEGVLRALGRVGNAG